MVFIQNDILFYVILSFSFASQHHINSLFEQLLKQENLSISWKDIILPIIFKISDKVKHFYNSKSSLTIQYFLSDLYYSL